MSYWFGRVSLYGVLSKMHPGDLLIFRGEGIDQEEMAALERAIKPLIPAYVRFLVLDARVTVEHVTEGRKA